MLCCVTRVFIFKFQLVSKDPIPDLQKGENISKDSLPTRPREQIIEESNEIANQKAEPEMIDRSFSVLNGVGLTVKGGTDNVHGNLDDASFLNFSRW